MTDLDALRRLSREELVVLDEVVMLAGGATDRRITRDEVVRAPGMPEETVARALHRFITDVRRIQGDEIDGSGSPLTFSLVYVPQGDAFAAYCALREPFDGFIDGCASRAGMETYQGRWPALDLIDFDEGLAELRSVGWAERCDGDVERWRLTARGVQLGASRLSVN